MVQQNIRMLEISKGGNGKINLSINKNKAQPIFCLPWHIYSLYPGVNHGMNQAIELLQPFGNYC